VLRRTGHAGRNPSVETPRLSLQTNLNACPQQVNPFLLTSNAWSQQNHGTLPLSSLINPTRIKLVKNGEPFCCSESIHKNVVVQKKNTSPCKPNNLPTMSTLEHLDAEGSVRHFGQVPCSKLHSWLSKVNGNTNVEVDVPSGVNRGKLLEELEARRKRKASENRFFDRFFNPDPGYGFDWREHENSEGYAHLEELLIFQPDDWRKQAREHLFRFQCDLDRESKNHESRCVWAQVKGERLRLVMKSPMSVVLFHPDLPRIARYEPLNFLLACGMRDPLPAMLRDTP